MNTSFTKYGEALKALLKECFNGDVIMEPIDTAFAYATKQTKNNLKFPFISFYPANTIYIDRKNSGMPAYHFGLDYQNPLPIYNEDGSLKGVNKRLAKNAEFLYIIMSYQIEVWATSRIEAEEVMQELLFWLYQNQQVDLEYNGEHLAFSFEIDDNIIDNSDLTSYVNNGKIYRYTCGIELQGAIIRSENYFTVIKPKIEIEELK